MKNKPDLFAPLTNKPSSELEQAVIRCRFESDVRYNALYDTHGRLVVSRFEQQERIRRRRQIIDAFDDLSRSRQHNQGYPQPLTIAEIREYLDLIEVRGSDRRLHMLRVIKDMDAAYLEKEASKVAK